MCSTYLISTLPLHPNNPHPQDIGTVDTQHTWGLCELQVTGPCPCRALGWLVSSLTDLRSGIPLPHWPSPISSVGKQKQQRVCQGKGRSKAVLFLSLDHAHLILIKGLLKRPYTMLRVDFYYHASAFLPQSCSTESGPSPFRTQSLSAFTVILLYCIASLLCPWTPELPIIPHIHL